MRTYDIGIDLDGVGYNLHASLAPYARAHGYPRASEAAWNRIDPDTGLHAGYEAWGITTHTEFFSLCERAAAAGALYAVGAPFPGFVSMMRELASEGHRLHIVTARSDPDGLVERATRAWLAEWAIPYRSLVLSGTKTGRGVELFIEDSPFRYEELLATGMTVPYLVTRPWNQGFEARYRVDELAQFVEEVRRRVAPRKWLRDSEGRSTAVVFSAS